MRGDEGMRGENEQLDSTSTSLLFSQLINENIV